MQKPSAELLIAYLDGELDAGTSKEVAAAIARDPALAREAQMLAETAAALRYVAERKVLGKVVIDVVSA